MKIKLKKELLRLIDLIIRPQEISNEEIINYRFKQGKGSLDGEASKTFGYIIQLMLRDNKINYLKESEIDNFLWDLIFDINTNPEKFEEQPEEEINNFYKGLIEKEFKVEVLLPLKNIKLDKDIIYDDFQLKIMDESLFNEWASETPWKRLKDIIGSPVIITTIKTNSSWKAYQRGGNKCITLISLFQILPRQYKKNKIIPDNFIYARLPSSHRCSWSRIDEINTTCVYPKKSDIEYLDAFSKIFKSNKNDMINRLVASLKFLADADTEHDTRLKIIKCFIALETMFIGNDKKKGSIKSKLMFRITLFYSRLNKGFPSPDIFPLLYYTRSGFLHQAQEVDFCKTDLEYLQKKSNSLIFYTTDILLNLLKFLNNNTFKSHKSFQKWLLIKDETYDEVIDWFKSIKWSKMNELK